ncbi:ankyrin [Anaeromyces robustus]|uniref:Ankyrin n=1 Tax=Anaeromyces robustus TaxID=1754192 RepID=A0A1Y1XBC5_9FUNG|nr:ankyrin [Anaeromyces robustus]|eukprot:ORX82736.1 ankyrin [Anaeromyces robustus]
MTISESYPLHRCVYRNDQATLQELLSDEKMKERINECDNHGNTPIHLALMLDRRNCIITLLNNNCDIFSRNQYGWNPSDEAIMIGDIDILEKLAYLKWKGYIEQLSCPGGFLDQWTELLPNLYLKLKLSIKTSIPILKRIGVKDIEEVIKKGSNIRFNTSVNGFDMRGIPKLLRGGISVIGKFDKETGVYKIILLDHKRKLYQEFFPNIPQWYIGNSLKSKIGVKILYKFYFDLSEYKVKQKKYGIMKKSKKNFPLNNGKVYKVEYYKGKHLVIFIRKRRDDGFIGDCISDINITKANIDKVGNFFEKLEQSEKNKSNIKETSNNEDSDSDDDSSSDEDILTNNKEFDDENQKSIFSKYIDIKDPETSLNDPKNVEKITEIFKKGCDENNNKVTNDDIEFLDAHAPLLLKSLLTKKSEKDNHKYEYFNYSANDSVVLNCTVSKDGNTKTYEIADGEKDTLDWEAAYNLRYPQGNDIFYEMVTGNLKEDIDHSYQNSEKNIKREKITEEQYFDPSSTGYCHLGRVMSVSEERKRVKQSYKFLMSKENDFPINLSQLCPLFYFIGNVFFDQFNNVADDVGKDAYATYKRVIDGLKNDKRFPLKVAIPLYPSVHAQLKVRDVHIDPNRISDDLFEIPKDYKYGNVYFKSVK